MNYTGPEFLAAYRSGKVKTYGNTMNSITRTIGIDPSLSATGIAIVEGGKLILKARITTDLPDGAGVIARALDIARQVAAEIRGQASAWDSPGDVWRIACESPQTVMRGGAVRSTTTLPSYGVVVGAVASAIVEVCAELRVGGIDIADPLWPSPLEWGGKMPTRGDRYKMGRVRLVEKLYGLAAGSLGPKTKAGDIADAVLIARWASALAV